MKRYKILITLFILLIIIVLILQVSKYYNKFNSTEKGILPVDTSAITIINFFPEATNFEQIELFRNSKNWLLEFDNVKYDADNEFAQKILNEIANIRLKNPLKIDKSEWDDYGVTQNNGIRIKVGENNNMHVDFITGIANDNNSYFRFINEENVYKISNRLAEMLNNKINKFRNGIVLRIQKDKVNKLMFNYQADSSFTLKRVDEKWLINDKEADTVKVNAFLNSLEKLNHYEFADDLRFTRGFCSLTLEGVRFNRIQVNTYYSNLPGKFIITSTQNQGIKFESSKNSLIKEIFKGQSYFKKSQ